MTRRSIPISPNWDTQVTVHEYVSSRDENDKLVRTISQTAVFEVQREMLSTTEYFTAMFKGLWRESDGRDISLHEDEIETMEILFRGLHNTLDMRSFPSVPVATIWNLIGACAKYQVEFGDGPLKIWFISLYEAKRLSTAFVANYFLERTLLYPCYAFDYAEGFQQLSQTLAYGSQGHISECNPTDRHVLHLPPRVMQQLNAARGRLRNVLHNGLFEHAANMLRYATCECKEKTFFEYFRELESIKVWPLENTMKHRSIDDIISNLRGFNASNVTAHLEKEGSTDADNADNLDTLGRMCMCRKVNWKAIVSSTADTVTVYFHGLCLDCMSVSKALREGRDPDHEYWASGRQKKWDSKCRISHDEPTWYFSFMGRREKRGVIAY